MTCKIEGDFIMACFLVPVAEAVITTVTAKVIASKEKKLDTVQIHSENGFETAEKIPFSKKLNWLSKLLWGGSALLCFEHVWHGEVVPFFPFLTAAADPAEASVMLHEMATVGTSMALLLTAVWAVMLLVTSNIQKRALQPQLAAK